MTRRNETSPAGPGSGMLIAVVGPSGSGKDALISYARDRLSNCSSILFVERVITRPSDGLTEAHATLSQHDFNTARERGDFAVTWEAHGLSYGIPLHVRDFVLSGGVAVVNGSRGALPDLAARFPELRVVEIGARREVLAARLAARGRENLAEIEARLDRRPPVEIDRNAILIENNGALDAAGERLIAVIRGAAAKKAMS